MNLKSTTFAGASVLCLVTRPVNRADSPALQRFGEHHQFGPNVVDFPTAKIAANIKRFFIGEANGPGANVAPQNRDAAISIVCY
jgi:hypothetical protein